MSSGSSNHSDANWRNTPSVVVTPPLFDPGRFGEVQGPTLGTFPPFLDIACGQTIEADLYSWGVGSFYRTDDLLTNQAYYSRQIRCRFDYPGPIRFTITSGDFPVFATLVRSSTQRWTAVDGVIEADIDETEVGPFVLEVTSQVPRRTGHFIVQLECQTGEEDNGCGVPPATTPWRIKVRAYIYYDHDTIDTFSDDQLYTHFRAMVDKVNALDLTLAGNNSFRLYEYDYELDTLTFVTANLLAADDPEFLKAQASFMPEGVFNILTTDNVNGVWAGNEYYSFYDRCFLAPVPAILGGGVTLTRSVVSTQNGGNSAFWGYVYPEGETDIYGKETLDLFNAHVIGANQLNFFATAPMSYVDDSYPENSTIWQITKFCPNSVYLEFPSSVIGPTTLPLKRWSTPPGDPAIKDFTSYTPADEGEEMLFNLSPVDGYSVGLVTTYQDYYD